MRVTLDLSALHGTRLDQLTRSALSELCRRDRIIVSLTPVFLDELVAGYGVQHRDVRWQEQLRFALSICNGGIFLEKTEIWREEIVRGRGPHARHYFPNRSNRHVSSLSTIRRQLEMMVDTGDLADFWADSKDIRSDNRRRRDGARKTSVQLRQEVVDRIKQDRPKGFLREVSFDTFRNKELDRTGRLLMDLVDSGRYERLRDQWSQCPNRYPFYRSFVEGFLFASFYAAAMHNERIDRNAQADYEQLSYLNWLDVMVSNDTAFLSSAFDAIWSSRGKRLITCQDFVALVDRLA